MDLMPCRLSNVTGLYHDYYDLKRVFVFRDNIFKSVEELAMIKMKRIITAVMAAALLVSMTACGADNKTQSQQQTKEEAKSTTLTVSAASSLKDAMGDIKTAYSKEKPNVTLTYNFGASGTLQQQIEQGAPVDLFISAAAKQMDALKGKGLIFDDTRRDLLGNELVLVVPKDSSASLDFKDLTNDKVKKIALGEPKSVPAGHYAEEVFKKLNITDAIKPKVVYGNDVKWVLTWVESSNADAGVVYQTDAKVSDKVKIAEVSSKDSHEPIIYPAAVLKGSKNVDSAKDFINYLYSEKAKPVFEKYGFTFIAK
jgi:molybdate transport system substrate-binding protein